MPFCGISCTKNDEKKESQLEEKLPCIDCPVEEQKIILCDDFEGDDLSVNYEDINAKTGQGIELSSNDFFRGEQSLMQSYTPGQVEAGWISNVIEDGYPDHVFVRWYHKFEEGFEGLPPKMARIKNREYVNWRTGFAYHIWIDKGLLNADIYAPNSSQANSVGYLPVHYTSFSYADPENIGVWVCIEVELKLNTSGAADGHYRMWVNGKKELEKLNVDLRGSTDLKITEVLLDCYWNGGSPKNQSRYYDDFIISTERIGCSCSD
jgi:hypothetical protein